MPYNHMRIRDSHCNEGPAYVNSKSLLDGVVHHADIVRRFKVEGDDGFAHSVCQSIQSQAVRRWCNGAVGVVVEPKFATLIKRRNTKITTARDNFSFPICFGGTEGQICDSP